MRSFIVRYLAVILLLCSGTRLHAAARPTAGPTSGSSGKIPQMQVPAACRQGINYFKEDMILCHKVMQGMFKEVAGVPGLKPSQLFDVFTPKEFVVRFRSLKRIDPSACYLVFGAHEKEFDAIFKLALKLTGSVDVAWQHVDDALQEKILEVANKVIPDVARECAQPSKTPTYMDGRLLLSAHQLQGGPVGQIEQDILDQ